MNIDNIRLQISNQLTTSSQLINSLVNRRSFDYLKEIEILSSQVFLKRIKRDYNTYFFASVIAVMAFISMAFMKNFGTGYLIVADISVLFGCFFLIINTFRLSKLIVMVENNQFLIKLLEEIKEK